MVLIVFYISAVNVLGCVFRAEKGIFQKTIFGEAALKLSGKLKSCPVYVLKITLGHGLGAD